MCNHHTMPDPEVQPRKPITSFFTSLIALGTPIGFFIGLSSESATNTVLTALLGAVIAVVMGGFGVWQLIPKESKLEAQSAFLQNFLSARTMASLSGFLWGIVMFAGVGIFVRHRQLLSPPPVNIAEAADQAAEEWLSSMGEEHAYALINYRDDFVLEKVNTLYGQAAASDSIKYNMVKAWMILELFESQINAKNAALYVEPPSTPIYLHKKSK